MKILISILLFISGQCIACSCVPDDENVEVAVTKAIEGASAVFVGEVINTVTFKDSSGGEIQTVEYRVTESFKGGFLGTTRTETMISCCMCGFEVGNGKTYLVYAYGDIARKFSLSICSRTREIQDANEDLVILRSLGGQ